MGFNWLTSPFFQVAVEQCGKSQNQWPMWNGCNMTCRSICTIHRRKHLRLLRKGERGHKCEMSLQGIVFVVLDSTQGVSCSKLYFTWAFEHRGRKLESILSITWLIVPGIFCSQNPEIPGYPVNSFTAENSFKGSETNMLSLLDHFPAFFFVGWKSVQQSKLK